MGILTCGYAGIIPTLDHSHVRSSPDIGHLHLRKVYRVVRADLRVAIGPSAPDPPDLGADLLVRRPAAHDRAQVVAANAEQARVQASLGRQPRARAVAAERLCDRGDHADLAAAVA